MGYDKGRFMQRVLKKHEKIFKAVSLVIYIALAVFSICYYFLCAAYGGFFITFLWFWPAVAAFSAVRIWMLSYELKKGQGLAIPKPVRVIYQIVFILGIIFFLYVESLIVSSMTAKAPADLEYIIVLGAGLRGTEPKNPLKTRISTAAQYLKDNPETSAIASGGQGKDEEISEAECIRRKLTQDYGIDNSRIILEEESSDTEENLGYCLDIIKDPGASVGIVSNGFHEYRAMMIADHTGYKNAHPIPAKTLFPVGLHYTVREFFGVCELIIKYRKPYIRMR